MGKKTAADPSKTARPASSADRDSAAASQPSTPRPASKSGNDSSSTPGAWSNSSWRGKASAIAATTRESISAASGRSGSPAALVRTETASSSSTPKPARSIRMPGKSAPSTQLTSSEPFQPSNQPTSEKTSPTVANDKTENIVPEPKDERPVPAAGWGGWWSKSGKSASQEKNQIGEASAPRNEETSQPAKIDTVVQPPETSKDTDMKDDDNTADSDDQDSTARLSRSSWFGLWGSSNSTATWEGMPPKADGVQPSPSAVDATPERQPPTVTVTDQQGDGQPRPVSGSWAFWSKEKGQQTAKNASQGSVKETGEMAVQGTGSQSHPIPSQIDRAATPVKKSGDDNAKSLSGSPASSSLEKSHASSISKRPASISSEADVSQPANKKQSTATDLLKESEALAQVRASQRARAKNIVLPTLEASYPPAHTLSYWEQFAKMFGRGPAASQSHLVINPTPPKLRKALAIGVHGYFPAPILQKLLGPPTGTSVKFASEGAAAIDRWAKAHNQTPEIEKIALEGEGMIANRIDTLWGLLLNWVDHLRSADLILFCCHSQGVPVSISLVAKLIHFGCLNKNSRIGICAMAGVNLGPFPSLYQPRVMGGSVAELFEFSKPNSSVSKTYALALDTVVKYGVRIAYIGSIDDQLVSLESSTMSNVIHPYIFRAVFVDGRIHAPSFITHLVGFALKLRNRGITDHGLIAQLSAPLAGSLYGGEGHSSIYQDSSVYDLAVSHTLETASLAHEVALDLRPYEAASKSNPFFLPWAMRGILEEEMVRTEFKDETEELLRQFDGWKPQTKLLQDVRFRLEVIKSKL